jgi:hypothetical protein
VALSERGRDLERSGHAPAFLVASRRTELVLSRRICCDDGGAG